MARDSRGVYYYVDQRIKEAGGEDYRVYVGRKGVAKLSALKDIVNDSEGTIFETEKGDLRLIVSRRQKASWNQGNSSKKLTLLDPNKNLDLIYNKLGAYDGEPLGSICHEI